MTGRAYGDNLDPEFSEALEGIPPLQERYSAAARPSEGSLAAQDGVTLLGRTTFDLSQVALGIADRMARVICCGTPATTHSRDVVTSTRMRSLPRQCARSWRREGGPA